MRVLSNGATIMFASDKHKPFENICYMAFFFLGLISPKPFLLRLATTLSAAHYVNITIPVVCCECDAFWTGPSDDDDDIIFFIKLISLGLRIKL